MLAVDVLGDAAEERKCNGRFDVLVTIDGRGNGLDDTPSNAVIASKSANLLLIVLSETESSELVFLLVDVIGFKDRREHRKTVLGVERRIEVVTVDAGDFLETQ